MKKLIKFLSFTSLAMALSIVGFLKKDSQSTLGSVTFGDTLGDALSLEKAQADAPYSSDSSDSSDEDCDEDEDEDEDC